MGARVRAIAYYSAPGCYGANHMAIKELDKDVFWVCYILFMVAILLLPVARNVYCVIKYKMSFSKYNRKIIDSFLENNKCVYVAKYHGYRSIILFFMFFILVLLTPPAIYSGDKYNQYYFLLLVAVFILGHIAWIYHYILYLYDACYMTNTSMLIRGPGTAGSFKIIQLHDIERYRTDNFDTLDRLYLCGRMNLTIITKCHKVFILSYLENREQLIGALKSFKNSIEETLEE